MFVTVGIYGVVLPAVVAGLVLVIAWRPWRRDGAAGKAPLAAGALAVAGGILAAQIAILGRPAMPPIQANDWLAWLIAAAALVGIADSLLTQPRWLRWWIRGTVSAGAPLLLLLPLIEHTWSAGQAAGILIGLAIGLFALWSAIDRMTEATSGPAIPLVLGVAAAGSAVVLAISGSASLGQLAGALAATIGASFAVALFTPAFSLARGASPVLSIGLVGLWINGAFYADVPTPSLVLLFAAPLLAFVGQLKPVKRLKPWQVALVRAGAVFVPLAVAAGLALSASPPVLDEPYW